MVLGALVSVPGAIAAEYEFSNVKHEGLPFGCGLGGPGAAGTLRDSDVGSVKLDGTVIVTPRIDVDRKLRAGDAFTCTLTIRSRRTATTTFQLEPYGIIGSKAPNAAFEYVDSDDDRWDATAGPWIEPLVPEVTIKPRGVAYVPVTVTVPAKPPVGSAYGSVNVVSRTRASAGENVVGIESQVATVFLLRVGGEGRPDLRLRHVDAPKLRWNRDAWKLTADLDNEGTLHANASGRVRVKSIFGNVVAELPIRRETVLPGGREPIAGTWKGVPWFGLYRYDVRVANGPVTKGEQVPENVETVDGWFIALPPWWVLALIALVLVALVVRWWRSRREDVWDDEPGVPNDTGFNDPEFDD
ncbi:MAG: hypothetical protein JWL76_2165 [Thermoleophilia bacterium]|nr:hypothetical protein [Thermoleophilia bacterium]